jgi:predicted RecA/RadA family phage recombinase
MATNYIQPGHVMEFTAPSGGVTSGTPVLIGGFFVIPEVTVAATGRFNGAVDGEWTLPRTASETWVEGDAAFWDVANAKVSIDPTVGLPIGSVVVAGSTSDTTGAVKLNGVSLAGRVFNIRKRLAVSAVNAGATLLAAIAGVAWRLVDAKAISVGGAATSVTTVDVKGTQSASVVKLVAYAQASLTQSTVLRDGAAGAAVMADGASYAACDVNTAITAGITGSAITVATSIDFLVQFALE